MNPSIPLLLLSPCLPAQSQGPPPATLESLQSEPASPTAVPLEAFDLQLIEQAWGRPQKALSVDGNPLRIGGLTFVGGLGSHATSEAVFGLDGGALAFQAAVGVDDEVGERGSARFVVLGDEELLARSPVLRGGDPPFLIDADLSGVRELVLIVEDGGDGINYDHADWGGARFILDPLASARPVAVTIPDDPAPDIVRARDDAPHINAPHTLGATPGRPLLFRVPTSGKRPLVFTAEGLPAGLTLAPGTGIISGRLESVGHTDVKLRVEGPGGSDESMLTIIGAEDSLARTPPMGWNSWNVWGLAVDDAKVRAAAD